AKTGRRHADQSQGSALASHRGAEILEISLFSAGHPARKIIQVPLLPARCEKVPFTVSSKWRMHASVETRHRLGTQSRCSCSAGRIPSTQSLAGCVVETSQESHRVDKVYAGVGLLV